MKKLISLLILMVFVCNVNATTGRYELPKIIDIKYKVNELPVKNDFVNKVKFKIKISAEKMKLKNAKYEIFHSKNIQLLGSKNYGKLKTLKPFHSEVIKVIAKISPYGKEQYLNVRITVPKFKKELMKNIDNMKDEFPNKHLRKMLVDDVKEMKDDYATSKAYYVYADSNEYFFKNDFAYSFTFFKNGYALKNLNLEKHLEDILSNKNFKKIIKDSKNVPAEALLLLKYKYFYKMITSNKNLKESYIAKKIIQPTQKEINRLKKEKKKSFMIPEKVYEYSASLDYVKGMYLNLIAYYYYKIMDNKQFLKIMNSILEKNKDKIILKYTNYNIGNFYLKQGDKEKAKSYFLKALKYNSYFIKSKEQIKLCK